jgi:hypothetical protein
MPWPIHMARAPAWRQAPPATRHGNAENGNTAESRAAASAHDVCRSLRSLDPPGGGGPPPRAGLGGWARLVAVRSTGPARGPVCGLVALAWCPLRGGAQACVWPAQRGTRAGGAGHAARQATSPHSRMDRARAWGWGVGGCGPGGGARRRARAHRPRHQARGDHPAGITRREGELLAPLHSVTRPGGDQVAPASGAAHRPVCIPERIGPRPMAWVGSPQRP